MASLPSLPTLWKSSKTLFKLCARVLEYWTRATGAKGTFRAVALIVRDHLPAYWFHNQRSRHEDTRRVIIFGVRVSISSGSAPSKFDLEPQESKWKYRWLMFKGTIRALDPFSQEIICAITDLAGLLQNVK